MKLEFFTGAARPLNEAERQAEVSRYPVAAFSGPEIAAIVAEAQALIGTEIAALSIIDGDRQRLFATRGTDLVETPRATAICAHAILAPEQVTCIGDLRADERFAANPLVRTAPGVRFYAGAPVVRDGAALGALCAIGETTGQPLSPEKAQRLQALAARIVAALEPHRSSD